MPLAFAFLLGLGGLIASGGNAHPSSLSVGAVISSVELDLDGCLMSLSKNIFVMESSTRIHDCHTRHDVGVNLRRKDYVRCHCYAERLVFVCRYLRPISDKSFCQHLVIPIPIRGADNGNSSKCSVYSGSRAVVYYVNGDLDYFLALDHANSHEVETHISAQLPLRGVFTKLDGPVSLLESKDQGDKPTQAYEQRKPCNIIGVLGPICSVPRRIRSCPLGTQIGLMILWNAFTSVFIWRACGTFFLPFQSRRNLRKRFANAGIGLGIFFGGFWVFGG